MDKVDSTGTAVTARGGKRWDEQALLLGCAIAAAACGESSPPSGGDAPVAVTRPLTFEAWKTSARVGSLQYKNRTDVYAVGERISPFALVGEDEAYRYYQHHVTPDHGLTLHSGQTGPGTPIVGSYYPPRATIKYCIDKRALRDTVSRYTFLPPNTDLYPILDQAFGEAAAAWNTVAGVHITHASDRDESCSGFPGDDITWYVKSIFMEEPIEFMTFVLRPHHNVLSWDNHDFFIHDNIVVEFSFQDSGYLPWFGLEGLLLYSIGNGLGFINESNRAGQPGQGSFWPVECRQPDIGGVYLSDLDTFSVMTHPQSMATSPPLAQPQCAGDRDYDYAISYTDAMASACQYRGVHELYYCNAYPQTTLRTNVPASCSPVPMPNGVGNCGATVGWDAPAAQFEAALLSVLMH
jgi:hypothetical protein